MSAISAGGLTVGSLAGVAGSSVVLGAKNLTVGGNNTATEFAGVVAGTGSLIKTGSETMTLTAANVYTGGTTVAAGTLALRGGDNRLASGTALAFGATSTLDIGPTSQTVSNLTFDGANSGTTTIVGTGTLTANPTAAVTIGGGSGVSRTVDLSGLTNFTFDADTQAFNVGGTNTSGTAVPAPAS